MQALPVLYKKKVFFSVGSSLEIRGTPIMPFCMFPELQVDFLTGTEEDSNIAFSLRVYFGKELVMNIRKNGNWGEEVKSSVMPFEDGELFDLGISVLSNEYQVTANGVHCHTFPHRLNPESVKMVQVWRDVSLISVTPRVEKDVTRLPVVKEIPPPK